MEQTTQEIEEMEQTTQEIEEMIEDTELVTTAGYMGEIYKYLPKQQII